jgi:hypothetical protein
MPSHHLQIFSGFSPRSWSNGTRGNEEGYRKGTDTEGYNAFHVYHLNLSLKGRQRSKKQFPPDPDVCQK